VWAVAQGGAEWACVSTLVHAHKVTSVAWSGGAERSSTRLVTGGADSRVRVWRWQMAKCETTLPWPTKNADAPAVGGR
jgi:WD40 repeat protein